MCRRNFTVGIRAIGISVIATVTYAAACWQQIKNPYLEADPDMKSALCGECQWECSGDVCGSSNCSDTSGCRCSNCGEEVPGTVFNPSTSECVTELYTPEGTILTAEGEAEVICEGIELNTNYFGGDCGCLEEDDYVSRDGVYIQPVYTADDCVVKCYTYGAPFYVFQQTSSRCWCKTDEGHQVR